MDEKRSRHHKRCRSNGGKTTKRNVVMINDNLHRAWHLLFSNMTPPEVAHLINTTFIDPDYHMVCEVKPKLKRVKDNQMLLKL
jgi:hypothetical protein